MEGDGKGLVASSTGDQETAQAAVMALLIAQCLQPDQLLCTTCASEWKSLGGSSRLSKDGLSAGGGVCAARSIWIHCHSGGQHRKGCKLSRLQGPKLGIATINGVAAAVLAESTKIGAGGC